MNWTLLATSAIVLLAFDLFLREKEESHKKALIWSGIWIGAGLLFNVYVWISLGPKAGQEYLAAYLIEKSLSLDNMFVFLMIFESVKVKPDHQHTVLFWGIFGAAVFRGIFIFAGAAAIERYSWVAYIFGGILLYAAYQAFKKNPVRQKRSNVVQWLQKRLPVTDQSRNTEFLIRKQNRTYATPLLIALVAIELTDIVFAIDSIPAAFSITRNPFIVYSSNLFAILGLRALYVAVFHWIRRFQYLHYGLAGVLGFAAVKMILPDWIEIHPLISVGVIAGLISISIICSYREPRRTTF